MNCESARQVEDLVHPAVSSMDAKENVLLYDDLFRRGDSKGREFWANFQEVTTILEDEYMAIKLPP